jgi:hypothetical protein
MSAVVAEAFRCFILCFIRVIFFFFHFLKNKKVVFVLFMEGIKTLERKDAQRESKTKLLLALKDDSAALIRRVDNETKRLDSETKRIDVEAAAVNEKVEKMTGWIGNTLKPTLVQLRSEQQNGDAGLASHLKDVEKRMFEMEEQLSKRVVEVEMRLNEKVALLKDGLEKKLVDLEQKLLKQAEESKANNAALQESVAARTKELLASGLSGQKQWTDEQMRNWTAVHENKMSGWTGNHENKMGTWARAAEERLEGALKTTQTKLKEYLMKEAEREAKVKMMRKFEEEM